MQCLIVTSFSPEAQRNHPGLSCMLCLLPCTCISEGESPQPKVLSDLLPTKERRARLRRLGVNKIQNSPGGGSGDGDEASGRAADQDVRTANGEGMPSIYLPRYVGTFGQMPICRAARSAARGCCWAFKAALATEAGKTEDLVSFGRETWNSKVKGYQ